MIRSSSAATPGFRLNHRVKLAPDAFEQTADLKLVLQSSAHRLSNHQGHEISWDALKWLAVVCEKNKKTLQKKVVCMGLLCATAAVRNVGAR